jgi:hypothetical protein
LNVVDRSNTITLGWNILKVLEFSGDANLGVHDGSARELFLVELPLVFPNPKFPLIPGATLGYQCFQSTSLNVDSIVHNASYTFFTPQSNRKQACRFQNFAVEQIQLSVKPAWSEFEIEFNEYILSVLQKPRLDSMDYLTSFRLRVGVHNHHQFLNEPKKCYVKAMMSTSQCTFESAHISMPLGSKRNYVVTYLECLIDASWVIIAWGVVKSPETLSEDYNRMHSVLIPFISFL